MKKVFLIPGVVAVSLAMSGCKSPPPPIGYEPIVKCAVPTPTVPVPKGPALVGQEYGMKLSPIPLDAVHFTDRGLVDTVAVQAIFAARNPTQTVQVTARVVNCTDGMLIVKARTSFMKANQAPSEPTSAWKTVYLQPRSTGVYSENSLGSSEVTNYLIEISPDR